MCAHITVYNCRSQDMLQSDNNHYLDVVYWRAWGKSRLQVALVPFQGSTTVTQWATQHLHCGFAENELNFSIMTLLTHRICQSSAADLTKDINRRLIQISC